RRSPTGLQGSGRYVVVAVQRRSTATTVAVGGPGRPLVTPGGRPGEETSVTVAPVVRIEGHTATPPGPSEATHRPPMTTTDDSGGGRRPQVTRLDLRHWYRHA